jgi:hypothetical protein
MKTLNGKFAFGPSFSNAKTTRTLSNRRAVDRLVRIMLMSATLLWVSISTRVAVAQSLKEVRVGSSNISVTNVVAYYDDEPA